MNTDIDFYNNIKLANDSGFILWYSPVKFQYDIVCFSYSNDEDNSYVVETGHISIDDTQHVLKHIEPDVLGVTDDCDLEKLVIAFIVNTYGVMHNNYEIIEAEPYTDASTLLQIAYDNDLNIEWSDYLLVDSRYAKNTIPLFDDMIAPKKPTFYSKGKLKMDDYTTFEEYMEAIDTELVMRCGLGYRDLADYLYRDAFDDMVPVSEVVEEVLMENDFPMELF